MPPPLHVVQPPGQWQGTYRVSHGLCLHTTLLVNSQCLCPAPVCCVARRSELPAASLARPPSPQAEGAWGIQVNVPYPPDQHAARGKKMENVRMTGFASQASTASLLA